MAPAGLPLAGYSVLVTRATEQAGALTERLEAAGAAAVHLPTIEIVPTDPAKLDTAIHELASYDWVVFTSANTVRIFVDRLNVAGSMTDLSPVKVAAVGSSTAERLREAGIRVDLVPARFVAEEVVAALVAEGIVGKRVLLPQADIARETLASGLREAGATVDTVVAYQTVAPERGAGDDVQALLSGVDLMTFASPSAVRNLVAMTDGRLPACGAVCIGPVTEVAAREAGIYVVAVAETHTVDGLIDALIQYVEQKEVPSG